MACSAAYFTLLGGEIDIKSLQTREAEVLAQPAKDVFGCGFAAWGLRITHAPEYKPPLHTDKYLSSSFDSEGDLRI